MQSVAVETSTSSRGVTPIPRVPDFEFLESTPRLWFGGLVGPTAFYNVISVFATEVEAFFIRDAKELVKLVKNPILKEELQGLIKQEANHSAVHARFNKLLASRGYPVKETQAIAQKVFKALDATTTLQVRTAVVVAGEHVLAEIGMPIIENPEMMADADPVVRHLYEWHLYEEQEHKAIPTDAYYEIWGNSMSSYMTRLWAVPIVLSMLSTIIIPSVTRFMQVDLDDPSKVDQEWKSLRRWMFNDPGYFKTLKMRLAAFAGRNFHPWTYTDNSHELADLHRRVIRPHWETVATRK